jgi:hypothetical protein
MLLPPVFQVSFILYGAFDTEGIVLEFAVAPGNVLFSVGLSTAGYLYVVYDSAVTIASDPIEVVGGTTGPISIKYGYGMVYITMGTGTNQVESIVTPVNTDGVVYSVYFGTADPTQAIVANTYISDVVISGTSCAFLSAHSLLGTPYEILTLPF